MIRITLSRELGARRLSLRELGRRTGVAYSGLQALASGKATRLDLATLDRICAELDCEVGDLLERVRD